MEWNSSSLQRTVQGITGILLSLKKNPVIRYQGFSASARRLAESLRVAACLIIKSNCNINLNPLQDVMLKESALFHFQRGDCAPLLLILDRRCDPITPLLNQVYFYSHYKL